MRTTLHFNAFYLRLKLRTKKIIDLSVQYSRSEAVFCVCEREDIKKKMVLFGHILLLCLLIMSNFYLVNEKQRLDFGSRTHRTPEMSAMHQDTSSDLRVVYEKLKSILEVQFFFVLV